MKHSGANLDPSAPENLDRSPFLVVGDEASLRESNLHLGDSRGIRRLPQVSLVTPSYNQARFLEETICSVLRQDYPDLEYLVIDGGSSDGSVEIIRKYEKRLAYWCSEKDHGQADAIVKGLQRASGAIFGWVNSDDVLLPGAINQAAVHLEQNPRTAVVFGDSDFVGAEGNFISRFRAEPFRPPRMFFDQFIPQPSAFMRRAALEEAGGINTSLRFCMDYDLWLRLALQGPVDYSPNLWSRYRVHPESKSSNLKWLRWAETAEILRAFFARRDIPEAWRKFASESIGEAHWRASIEYLRIRDKTNAEVHVMQALIYAPKFLGSRGLAAFLTGSLATRVSVDTLAFVETFFDLVPPEAVGKLKAYRQALARAEALIALNSSTPKQLASQHARRALRLDSYWVSNRHVLRRAL